MDLQALETQTRAILVDIIERSAIKKGQIFVLGLSSSEVAGGLMPAVGLALLLVVMLKKENVAYLLAGFVIMVITNCANILPIAIIAGAIAWIGFNRDTELAKLTAAAPAGEEGEFEDGI